MKLHRFAAAVLSVCVCAASAHADAVATAVSLDKPALGFAINPETSVVAIVEAGDTVRFYPKLLTAKNADNTVSMETLKTPVAIEYKKVGDKEYFVVLCAGSEKAMVLDAVTYDTVKEIPLMIKNPSSAFASRNPRDPYVYYCADAGHESRVGAIDLNNFKDMGPLRNSGNGMGAAGSVARAVVSADGTYIYTLGPWSPTGFSAGRLTPGDKTQGPAVATVRYEHDSRGMYVPDAFSQTVAVGQKLYNADLTKNAGQIDGAVMAFAPHRPVLISTGNAEGQFRVISTNSLKSIGEFSMNFGNRDENREFAMRNRFAMAQVPMEIDAKTDAIVVVNGDKAHVIRMKDINFAAEPFLAAEIDGPANLAVGQKATFTIKPMDKAAKFELKDAPAGMKMEGNAITWTPAADDIGEPSVAVRIYAKVNGEEVERLQNLSVRVAQGVVQIPFIPSSASLSPDASAMAISNRTGENPNNPRFATTSAPAPGASASNVAVIDLKTREVTARRSFQTGIINVAIDEKYVYAALENSDAIYILDRKDLSDVKRIFTNGRAVRITPIGGKLIIQTSTGETSVLKSGDFTTLTSPAAAPARIANVAEGVTMTPNAPIRYGDDILVNGIVFDSSLEKIRALISPANLRIIDPYPASPRGVIRRMDRFEYQGVPQVDSRWGVSVIGNTLVRAGSQNIGQLPNVGSIILPSSPVVASLNLVARQQGMEGVRTRGEISFRDLVSGGAISSIPLFDENFSGYEANGQYPMLLTADKTVVARYMTRLYVLPLPDMDAAKLPLPLYFPATQGVTLLGEKPETITLTAEGGEGPIDYSMASEIPGVDIDKAKGTLTVTPAPLVEFAINNIMPRPAPVTESMTYPGQAPVQPRVTFDPAVYAKTAAPIFKAITGRDATGIPVAVTLRVSARDKNLQSSTAERVVLLDLPANLVNDKLGIIPQNGAAVDELRNRISNMEKRVQDMDAKLDLLIKLVNEKNEKPK